MKQIKYCYEKGALGKAKGKYIHKDELKMEGMRVRLGYVAMSVHLKDCSPSQTMTYKRFEQLSDRQAGITRLETIARSNINHCLRLLKYNHANGIKFFRLSSRLIPLATHPALEDWHYMVALKEDFKALGDYANKHGMRIDFHPDHFNVINTPHKDKFQMTIKTLRYHMNILKAMGIDPKHRLVLHVGGVYQDKPKALERFVENWALVPPDIQQAIMIENDDKSFNVEDCLYLCEKLGVPLAFDLHHHLANHIEPDWKIYWEEIVATWKDSTLPIKMHISSPKSNKEFRSHADLVTLEPFLTFLKEIKGTVPAIDCMIEAKKKDEALFQLLKDLKQEELVQKTEDAVFYLH